jgi:hypothetical protein
VDNATYRKNVLKTLSVKPAKAGLKILVRQTARMNAAHAIIGIASETGELLAGLRQYVVGASKLTDAMKVNAFEECGDIGYYIQVAAKFLKVKVPGSGKKVKLKGMTRTEALLELMAISSAMLDLTKKHFYGPVFKTETKTKAEQAVDAEGNVVAGQFVDIKIEVQVVDVEATEAKLADRDAKLRALLGNYIDLFWPFVYETFEVPPANVFVGNVAKLAKRYPAGTFDLEEAEHRDTESEIEAMAEASGGVVESPAAA